MPRQRARRSWPQVADRAISGTVGRWPRLTAAIRWNDSSVSVVALVTLRRAGGAVPGGRRVVAGGDGRRRRPARRPVLRLSREVLTVLDGPNGVLLVGRPCAATASAGCGCYADVGITPIMPTSGLCRCGAGSRCWGGDRGGGVGIIHGSRARPKSLRPDVSTWSATEEPFARKARRFTTNKNLCVGRSERCIKGFGLCRLPSHRQGRLSRADAACWRLLSIIRCSA